jgi:undecaprenyl-diphosphatase
MLFYQIIILALIQGLTEFLPISSSAHLILPSQILNWQDQGLAFDLAVHLGTLVAVLIYLHKEIIAMLVSCWKALLGKGVDDEAKLAMLIVLGTLPAVVIGFFVKDYVENNLRSILVIAIASIVFGLLLAIVDLNKSLKKQRALSTLNISNVLFIGFAQALAFIPGTSRSGITITAALALGFTRQSALRFSFLLSIPLILAGGLLSALDMYEAQASSTAWADVALATFVAGISAYACIHLFMIWVDKVGMLPFVIYRVILGIGLFFFYFSM